MPTHVNLKSQLKKIYYEQKYITKAVKLPLPFVNKDQNILFKLLIEISINNYSVLLTNIVYNNIVIVSFFFPSL